MKKHVDMKRESTYVGRVRSYMAYPQIDSEDGREELLMNYQFGIFTYIEIIARNNIEYTVKCLE